jgi:hypothetical protein
MDVGLLPRGRRKAAGVTSAAGPPAWPINGWRAGYDWLMIAKWLDT